MDEPSIAPERVTRAAAAAAKAYRGAVREQMLGLETYLAPAQLPADIPSIVFQHTMKTAGTTLRALLHANLAERCELRLLAVPSHPRAGEPDVDFPAAYRALADELRPVEDRLLWAASHSAAHLLPLLGRPARGVTIVRDPVDRVLSRWFFATSGAQRTLGELDALLDRLLESGGDPVVRPSDGLIRLQRAERPDELSNFQSRSLLEPHHDTAGLRVTAGPPADAAAWRELLLGLACERYLLLVQDRLAESLAQVAAEQRWETTELARLRFNAGRPRTAPEALAEKIRALNWLDAELYAHACARLDGGA